MERRQRGWFATHRRGDALELLSRGGGDNIRGRRRGSTGRAARRPHPVSDERATTDARTHAPLGAGTEGCGSDDERRSRWSWHPNALADPGAVVRAREVERRDTPEVHERPKRQASGALSQCVASRWRRRLASEEAVGLKDGSGGRTVDYHIREFGRSETRQKLCGRLTPKGQKGQVILVDSTRAFRRDVVSSSCRGPERGSYDATRACVTSHHTGYSFSVS